MTAFELTFQSKLSTPLRVYANVSDEAAEAHPARVGGRLWTSPG